MQGKKIPSGKPVVKCLKNQVLFKLISMLGAMTGGAGASVERRRGTTPFHYPLV